MAKKTSFSEPDKEEMVKVACRQEGLIFTHQNPFFFIKFNNADEPMEVPKQIADIMLLNRAIYKIEDKKQ